MSGRRLANASPLALGIALIVGVIGVGFLASLVFGGATEESLRKDGELRGGALPAELVKEPAPRIRLNDAHGLPVDTRDLRGRPYLVTFVYTRCPDVCPLIGQRVREGLERLGPTGRLVTALFVSVDPRGDTPAAARAWLRRQGLPGNVRYLLGDETALKGVWGPWFVAPQVSSRPETSVHTAGVWIVDAQGVMRAKFAADDGLPPADLAHDLRVLLDEARG